MKNSILSFIIFFLLLLPQMSLKIISFQVLQTCLHLWRLSRLSRPIIIMMLLNISSGIVTQDMIIFFWNLKYLGLCTAKNQQFEICWDPARCLAKKSHFLRPSHWQHDCNTSTKKCMGYMCLHLPVVGVSKTTKQTLSLNYDCVGSSLCIALYKLSDTTDTAVTALSRESISAAGQPLHHRTGAIPVITCFENALRLLLF